jgi:H+/Cl- antiporter ClcA
MKRSLKEETVLFISIVKWVFLASVIGLIVGLSTTVFLKALNWSIAATGRQPFYFLFLPVALFLSAVCTKYLAPEAGGHGTEKVIEAVHKHSGKINAAVVPVKLISTIITLASGGSAGKEGPCAQIGAGLSCFFADLFKFTEAERKKLVICGISGGFASVFGTPLAGAIFGVEVLFVGNIVYDVLLPSIISGLMAYEVSSFFGITYFYHPLKFTYVFSGFLFLKVVLAGLFLGICSLLLIEALNLGGKLSHKINIWEPWKGLLGGMVLAVLALVFSKIYLGLGLDTIESSLSGANIVWYAFILKIIFTAITLGSGGSGGIITPIFFIGATAGSLFAAMLGLDKATFAAIGMVGLLAGAANTPIAAGIMAMEMFGPQIAPYAAVACVVSFLISGHRSVYPSQILAFRKSPSVVVETGVEIEGLTVAIKPRAKSLSENVFRIGRLVLKVVPRKKAVPLKKQTGP